MARRSARAVAAGALDRHARHQLRTGRFDPLAILKERTRGGISVYARGDDYHDVVKSRLKAVGRWLIDTRRRRDQGFCRHRPGHGKAARRGRRHWLARQAHQPGVARIRLVAVSRRHLHHARPAARCAGGRPLRRLPRLSRRLPDGGVSGAVPARCAALHFVSDHRAQGPDRPRAAAAHGQPHLWLRRLPGGVPVEQIRQAGREAKLAAREALRAPQLAVLARLDDAAFRALFAKSRGQAHRARAIFAQCADRDRQFRRRRARAARPNDCSTIPRRSFAAPPSGRSAGLARSRLVDCAQHAPRRRVRSAMLPPNGRQHSRNQEFHVLKSKLRSSVRCPRSFVSVSAIRLNITSRMFGDSLRASSAPCAAPNARRC